MQLQVFIQPDTSQIGLVRVPLTLAPVIIWFGDEQAEISRIFSTFAAQLMAVVTHRTGDDCHRGSQDGKDTRRIIEVDSLGKPNQCLMGRLADEWTDTPIVDTAVGFIGDNSASKPFSSVPLDSLLEQAMTQGGRIPPTRTILMLGTQRVLEYLRNVSWDFLHSGFDEWITDTILALGVTKPELAQFAPGVMEFIQRVIDSGAGKILHSGTAIQEMAAARKAAMDEFDRKLQEVMQERMHLVTRGLRHQRWLTGTSEM